MAIDDAINFRDIGGYRTRSGNQVKWGRVYRSGDLSQLSSFGENQLKKLGIKVVYDLRSASEIEVAPDRIPSGIELVHLPIYEKGERPGGFWRIVSRYNVDSYWEDFNSQFMAEEKAKTFGNLLKMLARQEDVPSIIHCSAGKDRAGIATALLFLAIGVPKETVADEYTLSNPYFVEILKHAEDGFNRHATFTSLFNMRAIDIYPFFLAKRETILKVMDDIETKYESFEIYFSEAAGIDEQTIMILKKRLLIQ